MEGEGKGKRAATTCMRKRGGGCCWRRVQYFVDGRERVLLHAIDLEIVGFGAQAADVAARPAVLDVADDDTWKRTIMKKGGNASGGSSGGQNAPVEFLISATHCSQHMLGPN